MSTEQDHIARARDGSHEAFTALVGLYQVRIRGYLARWIRDDATVDDLAQEVFMAAWRGLPGFAGGAPFGAWLAGIARNQALNHLRAQRRTIDRATDPLGHAAAGWCVEDLDASADRLAARLD